MCSCEAVCGQAVPEEKRRPCGRCEENACRPPPVPPRPPRATSGDPLCVRHTTRRTVWGVQLVRQGWSWVRDEGSRMRCAVGG